MPVAAKLISFNEDGIRKYIAKVGGEVKITIKFLKDSVKETKMTQKDDKSYITNTNDKDY